MKAYKINEHDVCLNPDTEVIFQHGVITAKIYLAQKGGAWAYGYEFGIKGAGFGGFESSGLPGFGKYRKKYTSRDEARKVAIEIGLDAFQRASDRHQVNAVISALKQALTPQLSLF